MSDILNVASQMLALLPILLAVLAVLYGSYLAVRSRREADERAKLLVGSVLSEDERKQLHVLGYLDVPSPNHPRRVYRLPPGRGMVTVMENGRCIERLCVESTVSIPEREAVLVHKLMIEGNEQEYLQTANRFPCPQ